MRYKDYVWPHNPKTFEMTVTRKISTIKIPFGRCVSSDLGIGYRVFSGEGEFTGKDAYEQFKKLERVFFEDGPGILVHPVWGAATAFFAVLSLKQEPFPDYVRYSFEFWEAIS